MSGINVRARQGGFLALFGRRVHRFRFGVYPVTVAETSQEAEGGGCRFALSFWQNSSSSAGLISLTAQKSRPASVQYRTLNPRRVSLAISLCSAPSRRVTKRLMTWLRRR